MSNEHEKAEKEGAVTEKNNRLLQNGRKNDGECQQQNILRLDRIPAPDQVMEFYTKAGIPEEKSQFISKNYETKVSLLDEFQNGKKISLYQEKQKGALLKDSAAAYQSGADILHHNHPEKTEGWDKITAIGKDPIRSNPSAVPDLPR